MLPSELGYLKKIVLTLTTNKGAGNHSSFQKSLCGRLKKKFILIVVWLLTPLDKVSHTFHKVSWVKLYQKNLVIVSYVQGRSQKCWLQKIVFLLHANFMNAMKDKVKLFLVQLRLEPKRGCIKHAVSTMAPYPFTINENIYKSNFQRGWLLLVDFMHKGITINADTYCGRLKKFKKKLKTKGKEWWFVVCHSFKTIPDLVPLISLSTFLFHLFGILWPPTLLPGPGIIGLLSFK